jgi:DNA-binding CsgD family transcriptional regulator
MALLAEACATLDDHEHAETLYGLLLPFAERNVALLFWWVAVGPASRFLGLLATTLKRWDAAERHFSDAIAMCRRIGEPPFEAYAQLGYADMLIRRDAPGDRNHARELLGQVQDTARRLGMIRLARLAQPLTDASVQLTSDDTTPFGLSSRETEVLRLVVSGKTDQEIADALYVSRRTVTTHVSSILNKLGVTSRTEAAALAVRHGLA